MKKNYTLLAAGMIALSINSIHAQCPVPSSVTATPFMICSGVTTTLNATAIGASINWFNVPSGGTSLGTSGSGANIVFTPSVTTIYYAESFAFSGVTTQTFSYSGAIQNFTVPAGITQMTVDARGAGGGSVFVTCAANGGRGARMVGTITVTPGQILSIMVGQTGFTNGSDAGGGGGSFVVGPGNVPLVIAGGGGGATNDITACGGGANRNGVDATITTSGTASGNGLVSGGTAGNGGGASTGSGGGGGGFLTNGIAGAGLANNNGKSYLNLGIGGTGNNVDGGGYGGGGAGWFTGGNGGGGGGYSGGGTSGSQPFSGGGGGGSYNIGTAQSNTAGFQSGNGSVLITYQTSCVSASRSIPITVAVNPTPTVSVVSGVICSGQSFTMVPSGASTYTYSSGSAVVSPTATLNYNVVGTSSLGCVSSNTAVCTVTVNALPTVTATTSNSLICSGQSVILTATSAASSYTWNTGAITATTSATPLLTTIYTASVTNSNGCIGNSMVTVTIDVPSISASTPNSIICVGETAVLTVSTSATTYTWNTGATTISTSVSPTVTTSYSVNGTSSIGCIGTANVNVTVNACTGINEVTASLISVYPNPNNGVVNITLTAALAQNSTLEIYDALGKLVVKQVLVKEINTVNMSNLDNGIYVFKVLNNNNTVKIGKLIKH